MKPNYYIFIAIFISFYSFSQENIEDRKKILDTPEIDFITSYYSQDGKNSAVTGGVGTEELTDIALDIIFTVPMGKDNTLSINPTVSAYSSASSSNINPFNYSTTSAASQSAIAILKSTDDNDDDDYKNVVSNPSPWKSANTQSKEDQLNSISLAFNHYNKKRTRNYGANVYFSNEYDYNSLGIGGSFSQQLNNNNTELGININAYLDTWIPYYPGEFNGLNATTNIYNIYGITTNLYNPINFKKWTSNNRNSYSTSWVISQVISKKINVSLFADIILQSGILSTPFNRIYFKDKEDFFVGNNNSINNYQNNNNTDVFHLADAIEKLPENRFKIPVGFRANYYLNDTFILRSYYRYYWDDWGLSAHTFNFEVPTKITEKLTITPAFRYYSQSSINYFSPYNEHLSTSKYYTSDYDLSAFNANQVGLSINYQDIFNLVKLYKFGMKNIELRFQNYNRSDGLSSFILTFGTKIVIE